MKPELAMQMPIACDLSECTVEDATIRLEERIREQKSETPLGLRFEAKVARGDVVYAARVLEKCHIPVRVVDHYDSDEWSVVARAYFPSEPYVIREEIWGPGA